MTFKNSYGFITYLTLYRNYDRYQVKEQQQSG